MDKVIIKKADMWEDIVEFKIHGPIGMDIENDKSFLLDIISEERLRDMDIGDKVGMGRIVEDDILEVIPGDIEDEDQYYTIKFRRQS